jgi:HlyD family secretion protein
MLLLGVVVAAGAWFLTHREAPRETFSGTIEMEEARLASRYGGRVVRALASEGDVLKPGQVILELEAGELQARHDRMKARVEEMEAGPRSNQIAAALHTWQSLMESADLARIEAERAKKLYDERSISDSELQSAQKRLSALEQQAAGAGARYALTQEGTRPEQLKQVWAELAELDAQLREMRVSAATNCVLEVLHAKVGDVLAPGAPAATVVLPLDMWVRVFVPEPLLGHVRIGDKAVVTVDAFAGRQFAGTVEQINRQAEFTPRNVQTVEDRVRQVFGVKVRLTNGGGALRAGMAADVRFRDAP